MISFLSGTNGGMESDGAITAVVGGVGYRVVVSDRDREVINKRGVGGDITLFCRTTASENEIIVYGFLAELDRRAFDKLQKVDGVGPSTALRILSVMGFGFLEETVTGKDVKELCKIPGIGKKTAEKLVAELKL